MNLLRLRLSVYLSCLLTFLNLWSGFALQAAPALQDPLYPVWTPRTPGQNKRVEAPSIVYNKKIYVFAGLNPKLDINNSNEVYDPVTNTWTYIAPMPLDAQGKPQALTHNGIALVDNIVWLAGGRVGDNPGPVTDKVWLYNLTTNTWAEGPRLPAPRAAGGLVLLGRRLHYFGGFGPAVCNDDRADHFVYDLDQPALGWQTGLAPLPMPRNHFGTVTVGGQIYAIGGQYGHDCGGGQDQKMVHAYDAATNTWTQKKDLPYANSHIEPGSFALDGKILVTGGERNGQNILQYDPATNNWTIIDQMPTALIAPSAKVIDNYYIVSHGGAPGSQQSQEAAWIKSITRSKNTQLDFWPNQLTASAAAGQQVTVKTLLGTFSDQTTYSINTTSLPGWLKVRTASGTTDESGAPVEMTLNAAGLPAGNYSYTLTATAAGYSPASVEVRLTVEGGSGAPTLLARINAGGPAVTSNGVSWSASEYFFGGKTYTNSKVKEIADTQDDVLYQTEYSATSNLSGFGFAMPVPVPGQYTVKLHFAEIYWDATGGRAGGVGQRVFSVNLEGGPVELANYDILADVGSMRAVVKTYTVEVGDGVLNIDFSASANQPKISAIEVMGPAPASSESVRLNAGGAAFLASGSRQFAADTYVTGGSTTTVGNVQIDNTADDALYQTERYGTFSYNVPVSNGSYNVILHFAETYSKVINGTISRKFHVDIEGQRKLTEYDILAKAGGAWKAVQETVGVTVNDGVLTVAFVPGSSQNPKVCAIEIVPTTVLASPSRMLSATVANPETTGKADLQVNILGNPIQRDGLDVEVQGAMGQLLRFKLIDAKGQVVAEHEVAKAGIREQHRLSVTGQAAGLFFLRVSTPEQSRTLKVLKSE
ncbi:malectin domain-containing carbohydrate-binding protein [Larkinella arboricola]